MAGTPRPRDDGRLLRLPHRRRLPLRAPPGYRGVRVLRQLPRGAAERGHRADLHLRRLPRRGRPRAGAVRHHRGWKDSADRDVAGRLVRGARRDPRERDGPRRARGLREARRATAQVKGVAERYRRVALGFSHRVDGVTGDGWDRPSPCAGWAARDIVTHLAEWVPAFFRDAGGPVLPQPAGELAPAEAWHRLDAALQAHVDDAGAAAQVIDHPTLGRHRFDDAVGQFVAGDLLIHTWDLARAAGLDEALDPELVH